MKIVSLLPSATEIVYALGLESSLEGVTFECDHPSDARTKRIVTSTTLPASGDAAPAEIDDLVRGALERGEDIYAVNNEAIAAIQPDLILAQDLCRVCAVPSGKVEDALEVLGCRAEVLSLDPRSLNDILDGIVSVGRAAGIEGRAADVVDALRFRIERMRSSSANLPAVRTLTLEWADPPFVGGHWVPEMVAIAGGRDVLGTPGEPSRRVDWRSVAAAAPEAAVFMPCGFDLDGALAQVPALLEIPELAAIPAVEGGRFFAVDSSAYFSRPGPRVVDGIELLAWALHPNEFEVPPPGRIARAIAGS